MTCDRCENPAAYTRKYSGEKLCSQCFSKSIVKKTAKTISKYKMIKHNELVAVAVSGGKDSLALLKVIHEMSLTHSFKIKVITIDEGIPGYRNEALEIVKKICNELNVEYKIYSYKDLFELTLDEALDLRENEKTSSCSMCGTFRRRAMDYAAKDIGADLIATGHNLDDTLQTFVINMLSGDTTKVGWMNPDTSTNSLRKIKPFCEIYESEIVDVSGAGDAIISLASILFYLNLPHKFIGKICNVAGGIVCMHSGVKAIDCKELIKKAKRYKLDLYL